jgi:UDP-N-acetylglucosamine--N-acetylmuramyl-(pentapeptide) pyrophosphoryl-undecaprenol N-acetylglucosamine transferase
MKKTIFIAGGGTGGHIYPGLAVAQALQREDSSVDIHFVGTSYGLESKIIPQNNFKLHLIDIGGLNGVSFFKKLLSLLKFPVAFFQCVGLILKYRPIYVFGVGGYSSGPFVLTAALLRRRTALFESNAIPGMTNRILSRFVDVSFTLFEESKNYLKTKVVIMFGFPVRNNMSLAPKRENKNLRVLIFGGSQGARGINTAVSQAIKKYIVELGSIEFVHQTGRLDYPTYKNLYEGNKNVKCLEYLDPIKSYYDWADLIFCRAGASTLSELSACGKAAVLVPFPLAADDHQKKNAESMVKREASEMILQKDFTAESFLETVLDFKKNKERIFALEKNIQKTYIPNAAQNIAKFILGTVEKNGDLKIGTIEI